MAETGNPNVYTNFKGKYAFRSNSQDIVCMLTRTNDVVFCTNITSASDTFLCQLPAALRPKRNIRILALKSDANEDNVATGRMKIYAATGNVYTDDRNKLYWMNGLSFNISDNYYS